jgi:glutathione-independent formaldehyde dehydrogenase
MKALVYNGARDVSIDEVPDAEIELPTDVVIKLTTTNICGSDLHMYEGRTDMEPGRILGHENLGEVVEVGSAVQRIPKATWCACRSTSDAVTARTASGG